MFSILQALILLFSLAASSMCIQAQDPDPVPLRNWPTPLYWQPPITVAKEQPEQSEEPPRVSVRKQIRNLAAAAGGVGAPRAANASNALVFIAITPCRVMDTRTGQGFTGQFGPPALIAFASRTVNPVAQTGCGVPSSAIAYSLNFTAVMSGPLSFLSVWPAGQPYPNVSTLNAPSATSGAIIANAAIVPAGAGGAVALLPSNNTDLIVDINGYFTTQSDYVEISENVSSLTAGSSLQKTVQCAVGKRVTGGSCYTEGILTDRIALTNAGVADPQGYLWQCKWVNAGASTASGAFVFYAGAWCSP